MKYFTVLLSYTPTIIKAIIDVEGMITTPKSGTTRKALVLSSLDAIAKDGETVDNKTVSLISVLIDSGVVTLNNGKVLTPGTTA